MAETHWDRTRIAKKEMDSARGSIRRRFSRAKDYKQRAEHLFIIVEVSLSCERKRNLIPCRLPLVEPMKKALWIRFHKPTLKEVRSPTCLLIFKE